MRFNWLARWLRSSNPSKIRTQTKVKPRLEVQNLEDRLVPATLIVNSLADNNTSDATLTLREAVLLINNSGSAPVALGRALSGGESAQISTSPNAFGTADTILFDSSLTAQNLTMSLGELLLNKSVTIDGRGAQQLSIDANATSRIFNIDDLSPGAGITVNISNITLANGNASLGGNGGAIFNVENLNLSRVYVKGNLADSDGGALFTSTTGSTVISASTFYNNEAVNTGGAIFAQGGTLSIVNSTITSNRAAGTLGGGLLTDSTTTTIIGSTILFNQVAASGTGAGIKSFTSSLILRNTIVAGNIDAAATPQDLDIAVLGQSRNNLIGDPSTASTMTNGDAFGNRVGDGAGGVLDGNINFGLLAFNGGPTPTHALLAGSRALDAGNNSLSSGSADQRGFARIANSTVDIGAYEAQVVNFVVDNTGDLDDGNYSPGNVTLREAITLSNENPGSDLITFGAALNNQTITLGSELPIFDSVAINGPGADRLTISGNGTSRIFNIDDGNPAAVLNISISNLAMTRGTSATSTGGAIVNTENLSLDFVEITNSTAQTGGGIWSSGALSISHSTLAGNNATLAHGGAIMNALGGNLSIADSTLSGNLAADFGAAIENEQGNATLRNSTIVNNRSDADGNNFGAGGLDNFQGNFTLFNTIVAGNIRGNGTSLSDLNGSFTGQNNLIGNESFQNPALPFNAITNPQTPFQNGANGNIVGNPSGLGTFVIGSVLDTNLRYNGGPTRTHALIPGSIAINAGNNSLAAGLTNDQRGNGFARIAGGIVDIGAFESQNFNYTVDVTNDVDDGNYSTGNMSLREAVKLANINPGLDTINFAAGLNNQTITLGSEIQIADSVVINGLGADRLTLSGNNASRIFNVDDGVGGVGINVTVSNLTLTQGFNASIGGAIVNRDQLTLSFVEVTNSTSDTGGGVASTGNLTVAYSTFTGNNATLDGGALYNDVAGRLTVLDSTISGNRANRFGSAISHVGANSTTVIHSTIVNNRADADNAGGGDGALDAFGGGPFVVQNSIIANNVRGNGTTPSDLSGTFSGQNNLIGNATTAGGFTDGVNGNIVGNAGNGTLDINTVLNTTLTYNGGSTRTHALVNGSPALNAGNTTIATNAGLTTDQRGPGFNRNAGAAVDIGAFESQITDNTAPTITSVTSSSANGSYIAGSVISIVVNFDEVVFVTGTPRLTLETGASDAVVNYSSGSGSTSLVFNYTVAAGQNSLDLDYLNISALALNNGTIRDAALNNANLTLAAPGANGSLGFSKNIVIDTTAPQVVGIDDGDADNIVAVNQTLTYNITFSEPIDFSSISAADFDNGGNATISIGNITLSSPTSILVQVTPTSTGNLTLRIPPGVAVIKDLAGNNLTAFGQDNDHLTVTASNTAPVNTVPAPQDVLPNGVILFSAANGNAVSTNDVDSGNVTVNIKTSAGTVNFAINYGVSVTGYSSSNMTISGPLNNVRNTLDTLFFYAPNAVGPVTVTMTTSDGNLQDVDTFTVFVVATKNNIAPTITAPAGTQAVTVNTPLTFTQAGNNSVQVGDIDAGVSTVRVTLKVNSGTLNLGTMVGLTVSGNGSNNLTLTGRIDHLNYNLPTLTYNTSAPGNDTLTITVNDQGNTGAGGAKSATQNVSLSAVAAPDVTPPTVTSIDENSASNVVAINSTVTYNVAFSESIDGSTVSAADFNNAGNATISFGNITQSSPNSFLVQVTPTSLGTLILRIPNTAVIKDLAGNNLTTFTQDNDTLTVATNSPPVNTVPATQTVISSSVIVLNAANGNAVSTTDADGGNVTVNLKSSLGVLSLASASGVSFSGLNSNNLTLQGPLGNIQQALNSLHFGSQTTGVATITMTTTDGAATDIDTFQINVVSTKVNEAPIIISPVATQNVNLNFPLGFNQANGNSIQVGDIDSGERAVQVILSVNSGRLNLASTAGLNVTGANTKTLSLVGPIHYLNAALATLTYTTDSNFSGGDTLTISVNDNGYTGTGGAKSALATVNITGPSVPPNQAPTITVPGTQTVVRGNVYAFSRGNGNAIQVADVDAGNGTVTVKVQTNVGTLSISTSGGAAFSGQGTSLLTLTGTLTQVNTALNALFLQTPTSQGNIAPIGPFNNINTPAIVITVNDNGFTGPGGPQTATSVVNLNLVTGPAVNQNPFVTVPGATQVGSVITFKEANNNAIRVGDLDAGFGTVQVILSAPNGKLIVGSSSGVTVNGANTAQLILTGRLDYINAALQTLQYTMNAGFNFDTLTVNINDGGNAGTGGPKTGSGTVSLSRT